MAMEPTHQSSRIKLTYFAVRGRVEPARLLLELAGVPYDFEGISVEQWYSPAGKARFVARTPLGQVPMLEEGSFVLCQSQAIDRYLARKLGLCGRTSVEQARIDEVTETAGDLLLDCFMLFWDPRFADRRPDHREATRGKLAMLRDYFARVSSDGEHWVLPGQYTQADVRMSYALEILLTLHPGLLEQFPTLHRAMCRFFDTKGVREYVRSERRPRCYTVHKAMFGGRPEETHHFE